MPRRLGAKNFVPFAERDKIHTTNKQTILHLARQTDETPLEQFKSVIRHQTNYLDWIDSRHKELLKTKSELNPGGRGPKDAVYKKYRWYAEQSTLLEAINGFEVFYKNTFISLATALRRYVPTSQIKGNVDAKVLWAAKGGASFSSLIFEHQLYHDLEKVDEASNMLVKSKRYKPSDLKSPLQPTVLALKAIFQIRHTISHNQGRVTQSDRAKLQSLGYEASIGEIIDPNESYLGRSVREFLLQEAEEFTGWILESSASYLNSRFNSDGVRLDVRLKDRITKYVGSHRELGKLPWQ